MTPEPRVSVVVAARDAERYLGEAIESALAQTAPPHEIVVVDDGSTDGTTAVARRYGARTDRQENAGPGAARNRGAELAVGDAIAFLDADDVWEPDKLERQLAALAADPAPDVVLGHVVQFVSPDVPEPRPRIAEAPQPASVPSVALVTRSAWRHVGAFREDLRVGEFMDWLMRARDAGLRDVTLPDVLVRRRVHGANQTLVERDRLGDYAQVLKRSLDRRRGRPA